MNAVASEPPPSRAHWSDPFLIACAIVLTYILLLGTNLSNVELSLALVSAALFVILPIEIARAPWRGSPRPPVAKDLLRTCAIKWLGVMLGLGLTLAAWEIIPEYRQHLYASFFEAMPYVLPVIPIAVAGCIVLTEWRLGASEDYTWHFGLLALGRFKHVDWSVIRSGLFGWLVRGFFLPLNFITVFDRLITFRGKESLLLTAPWPDKVDMLDHMIFCMLVAAIVPGYLFSSRLIGTDIKKFEQSWFGWAVTFLCYPPINQGAGKGWFDFRAKGTPPWVTLFGATGPISYVVGSLLLLFYIIHFWGEAICGLRSSHLTNRGIITNGPFRLCKHPVYVAKCLAWGLFFLPFLSADNFLDDVRKTFSFLALGFVYVLRGWIEERLLSNDPTYVAYALWVEQHGMFRWLGRAVPFFNYSWRLQRWMKNGQVK